MLEYLTKYTAKAGTGSKQLGTLFQDVLQQVQDWANEDGYHDLWRRTIMKFYNKVIGDRDFSLLEVVHVGPGLSAKLSSFGTVATASVSNWCTVKQGLNLRALKPDQRATNLSKLEL